MCSVAQKRWLAVQVRKPTWQQARDTKWTPDKVFVVYYGTAEIEALPKDKVQAWSTFNGPATARGGLKAAIELAVQDGSRLQH